MDHSLLVCVIQRACDLANTLGTKLLRGFSFYHPKGTDPEEHLPQVVDQLGQIADMAAVKAATERAAAEVEATARKAGLSDDTVDDIKRRILGIADAT